VKSTAVGLLTVLVVFLLTACGSRQADRTEVPDKDAVAAAYQRHAFQEVLELTRELNRAGDAEVTPEVQLYAALAAFRAGDLATAREVIPLLTAPESLDRIDLTEPVRFLPPEESSSTVLAAYVQLLQQLWESDPETRVSLRLLETTRIIAQRYGAVPWLDQNVREEITELERQLQQHMADTTPLGSVRSGVE
jgi:hypothetical protein